MTVDEVIKQAKSDFERNDVERLLKDNATDGSSDLTSIIYDEAYTASQDTVMYYEDAWELVTDFDRDDHGIDFDDSVVQPSDEIMELLTHTATYICLAIYEQTYYQLAQKAGLV